MNLLQNKNKWIGPTYIKYFLSYFILFTVLIVGFFFIMRSQLTNRYFEQRSEQVSLQLDNVAGQLKDELIRLSQIDSSITHNINLIMSRYKKEITHKYRTYQQLNIYADASMLISSIVYVPRSTNEVISTSLAVTYDQEIFRIITPNKKTITFDPSPYFDAFSGQLVFITNENEQLLLYFPSIESGANYIFFYILDTSTVLQQLKNLYSPEMPAIALITSDKRFVIDVNSSQLAPYMDSLQLETGFYKVDSSTSLCVHTGISNDFSMVAMLSNDSLQQQINDSFYSSYLTLMLLSVLGFLVILMAMRGTYLPLHRLIQKIVPDSDSRDNYLERLDYAFSEVTDQNQLLREKLDNYRLSIKKSLLDSIVTTQNPGQATVLPNIDQFFDSNTNKEIFAVRIASSDKGFPCSHIQKYFQKVLPGSDSCIILEAKPDSAVFLINYTGNEENKQEVLIELLNNFYEEQGYMSAISNGTDSPMDIPSLYENVMRASSSWPLIPVAAFQAQPTESAAFVYPYDKLNQLHELLAKHSFSSARLLIDNLFMMINQIILTENNLPDFFVRCVLVDILTVIINCMNQSNIKFKAYSDLYFETLYYCRSCLYSEKAEEIVINTGRLIDFYEQEISDRMLNCAHAKQPKAVDPKLIRQVIEDSFCQPDLSIASLADQFQISIAYTSYLIKKESNQNFSDYLWTLRLKKAKELLHSTNMSIDEVSIAVGYLNTSSFRRKFKQETGITPSQFRTEDLPSKRHFE